MDLEALKNNWEDLGESDPYWAVLTNPDKINNNWNKEEFYLTGQHRISNIFKTFDIEKTLTNKKTALDFGCGPGRLTQALCEKFETVSGVDISSSMIRLANQNNQYPNSCEYFVNNTKDLSVFPSNQFDFVFSFITLQHIEKQFAISYIKEFVRVTKEGGLILFNLPSQPPLKLKILIKLIGFKGLNILRRIYYRKKSVIEMHWVAEEDILNIIKKNQLKLLQIKEDKSAGAGWKSNFYLILKPENKQ